MLIILSANDMVYFFKNILSTEFTKFLVFIIRASKWLYTSNNRHFIYRMPPFYQIEQLPFETSCTLLCTFTSLYNPSVYELLVLTLISVTTLSAVGLSLDLHWPKTNKMNLKKKPSLTWQWRTCSQGQNICKQEVWGREPSPNPRSWPHFSVTMAINLI